MRINKPWKIHKWFPVLMAMPRMLKELEGRTETGFLGHVFGPRVIVQYWRSFEQLETYARSQDHHHWPAWVDFNKRMGKSRGDVGIWHETYQVRAGEYETVYSGMPPFGLGKASRLIPVSAKRESARERLGPGQRASHSGPTTLGSGPETPLS
jgi:hypothetical protein